MNTTNTEHLHQVIGAMGAFKTILGDVTDGVREMRDALSQIAHEETAAQHEESAKAALEHPETLTTEEDYEDAPDGTIVAQDGCASFRRCLECWVRGDDEFNSRDMATVARRVLRWGWGK